MTQSRITVRAVVEYAAKLRRDAERRRAADPHYHGYEPTEAVARHAAKRWGACEAITRMRQQAALQDASYAEQVRTSKEARDRHQRAAQEELARLRAQRRSQAPLDRIHRAMNDVRVRPDAPAAVLGGDKITGSSSAGDPPQVADHMRRFDDILRIAAERCEEHRDRVHGLLPSGPKPVSDEIGRLEAMSNLSPEEVAQVDPSLGTPTRIRQLRRSLSLDPETGRHVRQQYTPDAGQVAA